MYEHLLEVIPEGFDLLPAKISKSSSRTDHMNGDGTVETLVQHSNKVAVLAKQLAVQYQLDEVETEKVVIGAKLHDVCKYTADETGKLHYNADHAELAAKLLRPYGTGIEEIVEPHMQQWGDAVLWSKLISGKAESRNLHLGLLVAYADYKSSKGDVVSEGDKAHMAQMLSVWERYNKPDFQAGPVMVEAKTQEVVPLTVNGKTVTDDLVVITTEGPAKLKTGAPSLIKRSTYTVLCGSSLTEKAGYIAPADWWKYLSSKEIEYTGKDLKKKGMKYLLCSFLEGFVPKGSPSFGEYFTTDGKLVPSSEVEPWKKDSGLDPMYVTIGISNIINIIGLSEYQSKKNEPVADGLPF